MMCTASLQQRKTALIIQFEIFLYYFQERAAPFHLLSSTVGHSSKTRGTHAGTSTPLLLVRITRKQSAQSGTTLGQRSSKAATSWWSSSRAIERGLLLYLKRIK